ncbi:hypothetical protein [Pontibacter actiniarum]|uniref:TerB family tellurite resistance protein n=1 Tax=Pontibacter actiniarum TaxID=323450 RepID=A0A1X9YSA1_9BACT|nr:hypothetical protein [Pontibacter actiniarum]ARS35738.1 hypothetical protein CA264_09955 [Pontibacter actiniarum]
MKKFCLLLLFAMACGLRLQAQSAEAQQLLLNVEKLAQLKQLLSDMKQGYQVINTGYTAIRQVSEGNFRLHEAFLDGLLQVRPAVRHYRRVADILRDQFQLVRESEQALRRFRAAGCFSAQELDYLSGVYGRLLEESLLQLEALSRLITDGQLRMQDEERLQAIDALFLDVEEALLFLRRFNGSTSLLALQRARAGKDVAAARALYGITP